MKYLTVSCLLLCGPCIGCGAPQYPLQPENSVEVEKGAYGASFKIRNRSDTDVDLQGASYDPVTHGFKIDHATFKSSQSTNQEKLLAWMTAYQGQQREYWSGMSNYNAVNWQGANQLVGQLAPGVFGAIAGHQQVQMSKVLRPSLADEAVGLISAGKVDPLALLQALPPEIADTTRKTLASRGLTVAASQPAQ